MTVIHIETGYLEDPYLEQEYLSANVLGSMGHQSSITIENFLKPAGMQCEILIAGNLDPLGQQVEITVNMSDEKGMQSLLLIDALKSLGQQGEFGIEGLLSPTGQQASFTITSTKPLGQEAEFLVQGLKTLGQQVEITPSFPTPIGQQAEFNIQNFLKPMGQQADIVVGDIFPSGQQAELNIENFPRSMGQQADIGIGGTRAFGMEYQQTNIAHADCGGYLEAPYMEDEYLTRIICASAAMQVNFVVTQTPASGQQAEYNIENFLKPSGQQAEFNIVDHLSPFGMQAEAVLTKTPAMGQQAEFNIVDHLSPFGMQAQFVIENFLKTFGMQAEFTNAISYGMQATVALYNTTNLRILCSFPSRGLSTATGTNAWGNAAGEGQNWKSNSTEAGDFSPFNLNTDIVEEVWRSDAPTVTGIALDCDTERPQGVFLDTFAILNHNITSSATVSLIGSTSSTFAPIGVTIPLEVREDDPNIYYIAPSIPNVGYRYWRIAIDDPSNPDLYTQIGTVIFGAAQIFSGECFVDQVNFQLKDYTDSVATEAFTNVTNSRAQKKVLNLDFRSLGFLRSNFRLMRSLFRTRRTVLKCLWIPTPSPINQEYTARFALFSKLVQIPNELHNHKGGNADYVSFSINLDESK